MSYFPILIQYSESEELVLIKDPADIISGKGFKVLRTKVAKDNFEIKESGKENYTTSSPEWIGSRIYQDKYLNRVFKKKNSLRSPSNDTYRVIGATELLDRHGIVEAVLLMYILVGSKNGHIYSQPVLDFYDAFI